MKNYIFKGRLCGFICPECPEPLANLKVRLYRLREEQNAVVLANASDVSRFGFFQRPAAREFIVFVARTVALRTAAGSRQTVQHEGTYSTPRPSLVRPSSFVTILV